MSKTYYLHLRAVDLWEITPFGGFTVGYRIDDATQTITYTYSRVHPGDRYNKSIGRSVVDAHLDSNTKCKILTRDDIFDSAILKRVVGSHALSKLSINDLNWPVVTNAIRVAVENDLGSSLPINGLR